MRLHRSSVSHTSPSTSTPTSTPASVVKTDEQWRHDLTAAQYSVLRRSGTERPFSGEYVHCHDDGTYRCAACGAALFDAGTKFESGTGWPSFTDPVDADVVTLVKDRTLFMVRTEVRCRACNSHLGHVFDDGPGRSGARYCMNSVSLQLDRSSESAPGPGSVSGC
jgi:peptide-methionine (R)-S-oxide reductase